MKTSWNETEQIEQYLTRSSDPGDTLLFEANLLLYPELHDKAAWQKNTYNIVKQYGRQQLKNEIEAVHQILFNTPKHSRFSQKIRRFFLNK